MGDMTVRYSEERRVEAWGRSMAGRFWPGEGLPILALHGWLDNANSFEPLAQRLKNPVFALDFAGHGWSDHMSPMVALHYMDHIRDVYAVIEDLGWHRTFLLGHSMGAGVATVFAGAFSDRLAGLALIEGLGPPMSLVSDAPANLRKAIADMLCVAEKKKPVYVTQQEAVQARTQGFGGLGEAASQLLCERGLQQVPGGWTWRADPRLRLTSPLRMTEEQVAVFLENITVSTLLICAQQGMGASGVFDARVPLVPDVRVVHLPGGHHLHMENSDVVSAAINDFIDSLNNGSNTR